MTVFIFILLFVVLCTLPVLFIWLYSKQQEQNVDVTINFLQNKATITERKTPPVVTKSMERVSLVAKK